MRLKTLLAPGALAGLIVVIIVHCEGMRGLTVFLNLEAFAVVAGGTLAALLLAYPAAEVRAALAAALSDPSGRDPAQAARDAAVLRCAAESAAAMGLLGTVLGLILMLHALTDVSALPRRMALALDALLFGLFLAECVFAPLARRAACADQAPPSAAGQRFLGGLAGLLVVLTGLMSALYALASALPPVSTEL